VVLLAVAVVAALGAGAWWLLGRPLIRPVSGWTTGESFDFAKIVLAVVGGVGAVVALVVAYRRQQLGEAAEQREGIKLFAERFTRASDQLGAERPRSAGFDGADFAGTAEFGGARFGDAWFNRARFGGVVRFSGATFAGAAEFGGVRVRLDPHRERNSVRARR
jgi:pentapeptide repeat protein